MTNVAMIGLAVAIVAIAGILYPHVIYPMILWVVRRLVYRPVSAEAGQPTAEVILSAYNEAQGIERCLRSIASSAYPQRQFRVTVGDDGSSDGTSEVVERVAASLPDVSIHVERFPRSGKNAVVSALIERSHAEVVIMTDADAFWYPASLGALVSPFADEQVGAVVGRHRPARSSSAGDAGPRGDASYRSFEDRINALESEISSTVASNGALYAIRRSLADSIPNSRVADDWVNLLGVISKGRRVVTSPNAAVTEERASSLQGEVRRTVRTASSGMAAVAFHSQLLSLTMGWPSFFLWSHRVLRWASPIFLVVLLIGTAMTVEATMWFGVLFYGQFSLYALALLGYAAGRNGQNVPIASTCTYFVAMNLAMAFAIVRTGTRAPLDQWTPTGGTA